MSEINPILDYGKEVKELLQEWFETPAGQQTGSYVKLSFADICQNIKQVFPDTVTDNLIYEVLRELGYRPEPKQKNSIEFVWKLYYKDK